LIQKSTNSGLVSLFLSDICRFLLLWYLAQLNKTFKENFMRILFISMVIGIVAGAIDVLPMIIQKLDKRSILSAFLQYFFVSIVIIGIDLPGVVWWLQGSIIALALATPILIIVSEKDKKAVPIIAPMSIILGALIGIAGHFLR
jgi:hypothetical protein